MTTHKMQMHWLWMCECKER